MKTIRDAWRRDHREELVLLYRELQRILANPGDAIGREDVEGLATMLGLTNRQCERSETGTTVIIDLVDTKIDISTAETGHEHQMAQIANWIEEIGKPAKWERFTEVDAHVIHMHMKRLHADALPGMISKAGLKGLIPWHIDAIETDTLSIHLMASSCHKMDDDLEIDGDADEDAKIRTVTTAIGRVAGTGLEWAKLPGTVRRGNHITANHMQETLVIDGDEVRIKVESLPETLKNETVYIGRPLHEIVDIRGYRDDGLVIRGMSRRANDSSITFLVNRGTDAVRRRIDISR